MLTGKFAHAVAFQERELETTVHYFRRSNTEMRCCFQSGVQKPSTHVFVGGGTSTGPGIYVSADNASNSSCSPSLLELSSETEVADCETENKNKTNNNTTCARAIAGDGWLKKEETNARLGHHPPWLRCPMCVCIFLYSHRHEFQIHSVEGCF